jgi:hypothetical protein
LALSHTARGLKEANIPAETLEFDAKFADVAERNQAMGRQINEIDAEVASLREQIQSEAQGVLGQARLIGVTLSKICLDSRLQTMRFDTLIIDELSTVPFPLMLVSLALAAKRVVFFGDPRQLPPICISESKAAHFWLRRDTYEILGLERLDEVTCKLVWQRRMPPAVLELVKSQVYEGKLETWPEIREDKKADLEHPPLEGAHIWFVDTSSLNPWSAHDPNKSRYNLYSAEIVMEFISQHFKPAIRDLDASLGVAVICPYRAQTQLIKKLCKARFGKMPEGLSIHTIDAFQGEERDIVILDLVDGPRRRPGRLTEAYERRRHQESMGVTLTKARRLLNVAITRTKRRLVIVGNKEYFERELKDPEEFIRWILARVTKEQACRWVDGEDYLRILTGILVETDRFLDEHTFYRRLREDLKRCSRSLVILSPFITMPRVRELRDTLISLVNRGVKVSVVTRPLREMDFGVPVVRQLEEWGCVMKYRHNMHEKVVFVDNHIAYYGSLNVLSHTGCTRETMQRLEGEEVVSLLAHFADVLGPPPPTPSPPPPPRRFLTPEETRRELKRLRWKIAEQRRVPAFSVLYNNTIEIILDYPPLGKDELHTLLEECGEKHLKDAIAPFLDEIMWILQRSRPE